jgi:copper resistance protein C
MAISRSLYTLCLFAALTCALPALARTTLVSSTPIDGSAGPAPTTISLTFSDKVTSAGLALSMPGMKMPPLAADLSADGKTLTAKPQAGWMKGVYQIHWHAAGADGAAAQGALTFTVK